MKEIWGILKFLSGLYLIYLVFYFLFWYIKMHFHPKWFWAFWIYTIFLLNINFNYKPKIKTQKDYNKEYIDILYSKYNK